MAIEGKDEGTAASRLWIITSSPGKRSDGRMPVTVPFHGGPHWGFAIVEDNPVSFLDRLRGSHGWLPGLNVPSKGL